MNVGRKRGAGRSDGTGRVDELPVLIEVGVADRRRRLRAARLSADLRAVVEVRLHFPARRRRVARAVRVLNARGQTRRRARGNRVRCGSGIGCGEVAQCERYAVDCRLTVRSQVVDRRRAVANASHAAGDRHGDVRRCRLSGIEARRRDDVSAAAAQNAVRQRSPAGVAPLASGTYIRFILCTLPSES